MASTEIPAIDVWPVRLSAPPALSRAFRELLSPDEILRADRFAFEHLRASYQVSHGVLRVLLSRYLSCNAREIAFRTGPRGKPALCGDSPLSFNMSHSGGMALYAFTRNCEIGVDVEEVRDLSDFVEIASHYFCSGEASQLLSLAGHARRDAFYRCWTRKESYIKALGDGLYVPLDQFQVTLLPGSSARLVHIGNDTEAASEWNLHHLEPAPGYVGAIAYPGKARRLVEYAARDAQDILHHRPT